MCESKKKKCEMNGAAQLIDTMAAHQRFSDSEVKSLLTQVGDIYRYIDYI